MQVINAGKYAWSPPSFVVKQTRVLAKCVNAVVKEFSRKRQQFIVALKVGKGHRATDPDEAEYVKDSYPQIRNDLAKHLCAGEAR
jgi:hypothetical protein